MGFNRGHFFSALAGLIVGVMLISALPGLAANGDNMILGQKNNALQPTKLVSRGGLVLQVGIPARSALTLVVVGDEPPMKVNSTGLVTSLNADLLDGMQAAAFAVTGHDHDADYLAIGAMAADAALLGGYAASVFYRTGVVDEHGLPSLGAECLHEGGPLLAVSPTGIPVCGNPGGTGTFTDSGQVLGAGGAYGVALGDLDGDGDLDAYVARETGGDKVWMNDGSGAFADSGQSLVGGWSTGVALGDLDGDGDLDAYVAGYGVGNHVWFNDGSGGFTDSGQVLGSETAFNASLGDLDGDGDLDAVSANYGTNRIWVNDGSGTFSSGQAVGTLRTHDIALGDLDGDGDLDLFVGNYSSWGTSGANQVFLNDGNGSFSGNGQSLGDEATFSVALDDLDGDGDIDAYAATAEAGDRVWLNNGSGTFSDSGQSLGTADSYRVGLGDLEGDGDSDAFVTNDVGGAKVWVNDGSGSFVDSGQSLGDGDRALALGDLSGDGDLDAVTAKVTSASHIWLNDDAGFASTDHDHDTDYLAIDGTAADSELLDGLSANEMTRIGYASTQSFTGTLETTVTAPTSGFIVMSGSAWGYLPGNWTIAQDSKCFLSLDGTGLAASDRWVTVFPGEGTWEEPANRVTCTTDIVMPVDSGSHTVQFSSSFSSDDASVWALFVPFDGTGQPPPPG